MWFLKLFDTIGAGVVSWVERKMKIAEIEAETKAKVLVANTEATIAMQARAQAGEIDWDVAAVRQMETSWKDEWFTLLLSIPLILCFVPFEWAKRATLDGFAMLEQMPEWYRYALGLAIAASFGWRGFTKFMSNRK